MLHIRLSVPTPFQVLAYLSFHDAQPIIPPDLREEPRRPVNSNVECPLSCAGKDGSWPNSALEERLHRGLASCHRSRQSGQVEMDSVFKCGRNTQTLHQTFGAGFQIKGLSAAEIGGTSGQLHRPPASTPLAISGCWTWIPIASPDTGR